MLIHCWLTSHDIKLPPHKVFYTTEETVCGTQHSTQGWKEEREEAVSINSLKIVKHTIRSAFMGTLIKSNWFAFLDFITRFIKMPMLLPGNNLNVMVQGLLLLHAAGSLAHLLCQNTCQSLSAHFGEGTLQERISLRRKRLHHHSSSPHSTLAQNPRAKTV